MPTFLGLPVAAASSLHLGVVRAGGLKRPENFWWPRCSGVFPPSGRAGASSALRTFGGLGAVGRPAGLRTVSQGAGLSGRQTGPPVVDAISRECGHSITTDVRFFERKMIYITAGSTVQTIFTRKILETKYAPLKICTQNRRAAPSFGFTTTTDAMTYLGCIGSRRSGDDSQPAPLPSTASKKAAQNPQAGENDSERISKACVGPIQCLLWAVWRLHSSWAVNFEFSPRFQ
jgi:hypothetical protein